MVRPYADKQRAITEIASVLAKGDLAVRIHPHGLVYPLRYLLEPDVWRQPIYAARTILNTMVYRVTGRRISGFVGDAIFQSDERLDQYYRSTD